MTELEEARAMVESLSTTCERAARFIRYYHDKPDELRAWATRIESNPKPGESLPALTLESTAREGRRFLAERWGAESVT